MIEKIKSFLGWEGPGQHVRFRHFKKAISKLPLKPNLKVLDAGAGQGSYSIFIAKKIPGSQIKAIDVDEAELEVLRHKLPDDSKSKISVKKESVTDNQGREEYDLVICVDVLEHVDDDLLALKNLKESLKKNGLLFLHVPYPEPKRYLKQFVNFPHQHDHVREGYTKMELEKKLKEIGFSSSNSWYTFGRFGALSWEFGQKFLKENNRLKKLPLLLASYLLGILDPFFINPAGNGIAVIATKK